MFMASLSGGSPCPNLFVIPGLTQDPPLRERYRLKRNEALAAPWVPAQSWDDVNSRISMPDMGALPHDRQSLDCQVRFDRVEHVGMLLEQGR